MSVEKKNSVFTDQVAGKAVVADTSSLLVCGPTLLTVMKNCTLIVPAIVVKELEEKRSHPTVGFLAREWLRLFEQLRVNYGVTVQNGVCAEGHPDVTIRIEPNHSHQSNLPKHLQDGSNDSTILAVAKNFSKEFEGTDVSVVLLSNDTPMRLHATLDLDIEAMEFNATLVTGAKPFDGRIVVDVAEGEYLDAVSKIGPNLEKVVSSKISADSPKNAFVVAELDGNTKSLDDYIYRNGHLSTLVRKQTASGIRSRTTEQDVAMNYLKTSAEELPIVSVGGSAGTGKTLIAVAVALEELKKENYQRIIVFRSLHEMGQGQELGFLPGNVDEKMEAWAGAVYDSLDVIAAAGVRRGAGSMGDKVKAVAAELRRKIEVSPITFLRGRSLSNSFIILDEAQNFSRSELLNILSRVGEGTKIVMIGDADQVDNRFLQSGSKADVWSVIESLKSSDLFAHITLNRTERSRVAELSALLLADR